MRENALLTRRSRETNCAVVCEYFWLNKYNHQIDIKGISLGFCGPLDAFLSLEGIMIYRIVCARCQKEMGEKECPGSMIMNDAITHSICEC